MKKLCLLFCGFVVISCAPDKIPADLLVKNAIVYTVNENFDKASAFVVKDGKILEIGLKPELELKYIISETFDAMGRTIVPGLIDAHAHLYGLGIGLQKVNLVGTKSFDEVLDRVVQFQKEKNVPYIIGRGWDQNDWDVKEFPTNEKLDSLFPDTPVALERIDGHATIVNSLVLNMTNITSRSKIEGGEVIVKNNKPTGVLVDNARDVVFESYPDMDKAFIARSLKDGADKCIQMGLTSVNDAGLDRVVIEVIDSLQRNNEMSLRVYAMISNSDANLDYYLKKGIFKTDRLNVRSVKLYGDGALGSWGAAMRQEYSDLPGHFGSMTTSPEEIELLAKRIAATDFQLNTHAIGDSAVTTIIRTYQKVLKDKSDARWKVEHAQVATISDIDLFSNNIIPSVQPTHATSDMYWAEDRVGKERIKGAYAYKSLLNKAGIIVLGTDFPVENVNPMHTFYAAVARKDLNNYPDGGYRIEEGLSRKETLKGMTIWAAYSNFEEDEKGSIEEGKFADFTVLEKDIMTIPIDSVPNVKVVATFINGEKVYEVSPQ
jgi:predicted amidohydrolase YtcJ